MTLPNKEVGENRSKIAVATHVNFTQFDLQQNKKPVTELTETSLIGSSQNHYSKLLLFSDGFLLYKEPFMIFFNIEDFDIGTFNLEVRKFLKNVGITSQREIEKKVREINKLEKEVEELSTDYVTLKNNYMFSRKETEVLKRVEKLNLNISKKPPEKISIEDEY